MQTVRQIERLWTARQYGRLFRELSANRAEAGGGLAGDPGSIAAAAMALIRLDELNQPHVPLYRKLLDALLASQQADGGWDDVILTALALRALMLGRNTSGQAILGGLAYLAALQKPDGLWPAIPFRRMPSDTHVSAMVLYHLGEDDRFRNAVQFDQAVQKLDADRASLAPDTRRLWDRVVLRCRSLRVGQPMLTWSKSVPNAA